MEFRTIQQGLIIALLAIVPGGLYAQTTTNEEFFYTELTGPEEPEETPKTQPFFLPRSESERNRDKYGPVLASDTLWSIANRFRPSPEVSIYQTMQAIWEMNPRAFIDQDYQKLKEGVFINVPSHDMVMTVDENTARAHFKAPMLADTATSDDMAVMPESMPMQSQSSAENQKGVIQTRPMPKPVDPMQQAQIPGMKTQAADPQNANSPAQAIQTTAGDPRTNPVRPATIAQGEPPEEDEVKTAVSGPQSTQAQTEQEQMSDVGEEVASPTESPAASLKDFETFKSEIKETLSALKETQSTIDETKIGLVEADTQLKGLLDENHRLKMRVQKMSEELIAFKVELEGQQEIKEQVMDLLSYRDAMEMARKQAEIEKAEEEASNRMLAWIVGIVSTIAAAVGGGAFWWFNRKNKEDEDNIEDFLEQDIHDQEDDLSDLSGDDFNEDEQIDKDQDEVPDLSVEEDESLEESLAEEDPPPFDEETDEAEEVDEVEFEVEELDDLDEEIPDLDKDEEDPSGKKSDEVTPETVSPLNTEKQQEGTDELEQAQATDLPGVSEAAEIAEDVQPDEVETSEIEGEAEAAESPETSEAPADQEAEAIGVEPEQAQATELAREAEYSEAVTQDKTPENSIKTGVSKLINTQTFNESAVANTHLMGSRYAEIQRQSDISYLLSGENEADQVQSQLDLARGFAEIGDQRKAIDLLHQIIQQGNDEEIQEAKRLVAYLKQRMIS